MFDQAMLHAVASDRMSDARAAADLHRQRVALRGDARSVLATSLARLAVRLDPRAGCASDHRGAPAGPIATDRDLCRAA